MVRDASGNVVEGGYTLYQPTGEKMFIYDAAQNMPRRARRWSSSQARVRHRFLARHGRPRAPSCLASRAVIAESFERIHRSNLVGMGVVPLVFQGDTTWDSLGLQG